MAGSDDTCFHNLWSIVHTMDHDFVDVAMQSTQKGMIFRLYGTVRCALTSFSDAL